MVYSVQVKRLKHESPLDALILRSAKRKRSSDEDEGAGGATTGLDLVFRLARTYDFEQPGNRVLLESVVQASESKPREYRSAVKRQRKNESEASPSRLGAGPSQSGQAAPSAEDEGIHDTLRAMIAEYVTPQLEAQAVAAKEDADAETEDYVYDIYFGEPAGPIAISNAGHIELSEREEKLLLESEDTNPEDPYLGGDEDSNAEDYYANDYPDEESDASEQSLTGMAEFDDENAWGSRPNSSWRSSLEADRAQRRSHLSLSDDEDDLGSEFRHPLEGGANSEPEWSLDEAEDAEYERYGFRAQH